MTRVAAIIHDADHYYAVLEIFVTPKCIVIYDGLSRELLQWIDYVVCAMKCCMLIPLEADYVACADNPTWINPDNVSRRKSGDTLFHLVHRSVEIRDW